MKQKKFTNSSVHHVGSQLTTATTVASYVHSCIWREFNNNEPYSECKYSLTFRIRRYTYLQCIRLQAYMRVCCHSNETRALEGTPTIPQVT